MRHEVTISVFVDDTLVGGLIVTHLDLSDVDDLERIRQDVIHYVREAQREAVALQKQDQIEMHREF